MSLLRRAASDKCSGPSDSPMDCDATLGQRLLEPCLEEDSGITLECETMSSDVGGVMTSQQLCDVRTAVTSQQLQAHCAAQSFDAFLDDSCVSPFSSRVSAEQCRPTSYAASSRSNPPNHILTSCSSQPLLAPLLPTPHNCPSSTQPCTSTQACDPGQQTCVTSQLPCLPSPPYPSKRICIADSRTHKLAKPNPATPSTNQTLISASLPRMCSSASVTSFTSNSSCASSISSVVSGGLRALHAAVGEVLACGFYHEGLGQHEAHRALQGRPEGTFILRDSSDSRYLLSISVATDNGITSVRVAGKPGGYYLDCHESLRKNFPHFRSPLQLVAYFMMLSTSNKQCVWRDANGRKKAELKLLHPLYTAAPSLSALACLASEKQHMRRLILQLNAS